MLLPLSALDWDSFSINVWLGDEVLTSQPCNISICVSRSWQMNPTLNITAWHHMKITAMSSSCQICSCHCDGELSFIICCACLCQLLLTVCIDLQEQRGTEVTLINTLHTHGNHTELTFHYLRQKGLKTKNMLRDAGLQYNNMTIIKREMVGLCYAVRSRSLLCTGDKCAVSLILHAWPFSSAFFPCGLVAFPECLQIKYRPLRCFKITQKPKKDIDWSNTKTDLDCP